MYNFTTRCVQFWYIIYSFVLQIMCYLCSVKNVEQKMSFRFCQIIQVISKKYVKKKWKIIFKKTMEKKKWISYTPNAPFWKNKNAVAKNRTHD